MALTFANEEKDMDIYTNLDKYAGLHEKESTLQQAYEDALSAAIAQNPMLSGALEQLNACREDLEKTKADITDLVRNARDTFKTGRIGAHFSDPVSVTYDLRILEKHFPEAGKVPHLIDRVVDSEVLELAVAAGQVPKAAADAAKIETPRYRDGRVQIRLNR